MRLAYVVGVFPSLTETFIWREMEALEGLGEEVFLLALRRGSEGASERMRRWMAKARYPLRWQGAGVAMRHWPRAVRFLQEASLVGSWRGRLLHGRHALTGWGWVPLLRRWKVEAVHAHFANLPAWAAWAAAEMAGLPFSFSAHAWDVEFETETLPAKMAAARFVVTCNEFNRRRLAERFPEMAGKVRVLYHGLEEEWFQPLPSLPLEALLPRPSPLAAGGPVLLGVGRLVEKKGFQVLLAALELLAKEGVPFRLALVGDGPLRTSLKLQAERPPLKGRVWLAGARPVEEVRRFYRAADLVVQPSLVTPAGDRDGLPNVILEAMACRRPVVASRVAAIPEAVEDGVTGYLVPPNDPMALAQALKRALGERSRWAVMGERAWQRARERFRLERNVAVLREWLREKSAS